MVPSRGATCLALAGAASLWRAAAWSADDVHLTELPGTAARCLDGTPAGLYLDRATDPHSRNKWAMVLQGGAQCDDAKMCHLIANGTLGSSHYFGQTLGQHAGHFLFWMSGDQEENPVFSSWNRVYVPYCSQDLWSGTRSEKSEETFGLYFSGHLIVQAVMKHLIAQEGMAWATDIILGGVSAGGVGSWLNAGYIFRMLPLLKTAIHAPIAGFYFPTRRYYGVGWHEPWKDEINSWSLRRDVQLWRSHMDEHCTSRMPGSEHLCMLSAYSAQHVPWRVFVIEAQSDAMQLRVRDGLPGDCHQDAPDCQAFMEGWRRQLMDALRRGLKPTDGWFTPACFMHHRFFALQGPWIFDRASGKDVGYMEALNNFYHGRTVRLEDQCGITCGKCGAAIDVERRVLEPAPALLL